MERPPVSDPQSEPTSEPAAPKSRSRLPLVAIAGAALLGLGAVYGIGGLGGNAGEAGKCATTLATAAKLKPFARGDVAAFTPAETRRDLSTLAFDRAGPEKTTLAAWNGRVVLLDLWATWCVPCRKEMPDLDRLQKKLGSTDFEVVAINLDTRDPERPKKFLAEIGVDGLGWYADASLASMKALQKVGILTGLPTTVLVGRDGCELGTLAGPADWNGAAAEALVTAAVKAR